MTRPLSMTGAHPAWQMMAEMHRPTGAALQAEIRRLAEQGLKPHDISAVLRVGVAAVVQALREVAV
jgi:hypothetical protein